MLQYSVTALHYLADSDQLWILVGNQAQFQTIMVLDEASRVGAASPKPLLPQHNVFDSVSIG